MSASCIACGVAASVIIVARFQFETRGDELVQCGDARQHFQLQRSKSLKAAGIAITRCAMDGALVVSVFHVEGNIQIERGGSPNRVKGVYFMSESFGIHVPFSHCGVLELSPD